MNIKDLTIISNNCGINDWGIGILVNTKQIKKLCISFLGRNTNAAKEYLNGNISIEFIPQGTLAERIRCGGAGIPAFYTPTGLSSIIQDGNFPIRYNKDKIPIEVSIPRDIRVFNNRPYILEYAINGDIAIIKAYKVDTFGNIQFRSTSQNFNYDMATCAKYTIVEADNIVNIGELKPNDIHLSGIYVDYIIQTKESKRFEVNPSYNTTTTSNNKKEIIAKYAAKELKDNTIVNLGVGIPTLIAKYIRPEQGIFLHSENGIIGYKTLTDPIDEDYDSINASKEPISLIPGSCVFSSSQSFSMIRGGHIDTTILGGMQVSKYGDLSNWITDDDNNIRGMGGAMDLISNSKNVIVAMEHTTKKNLSKIVNSCSLPFTGKRCVNSIITELCKFDIDKDSGILYLRKKYPNVTIEEIERSTDSSFIIDIIE